MPDAVIENALKALKQRRDDLDRAIKSLQGANGSRAASVQPRASTRGTRRRKGKPMSAAVKAKLRAAYAANHPGWKPKKR